jgi:hypothetical protein
MKPEEAVVFLSRRQPDPVLIHVPDIPIDKRVDWNHLQRTMEPRIQRLFTLQPATDPSPTQGQLLLFDSTLQPRPVQSSATPTARSQDLNDRQTDEIPLILMDVYNHPFLGKTERLRALFGTSASKGQRMANSVLHAGYVKEHDVQVGGRGGATKLWEITEKGYAAIGFPRRVLPGKGDLPHKFLQHKVAEKLSDWGFKPRIEYFQNGKSVDVGIESETGPTAVEIATTAGNEVNNLLKDVEAGFSRALILAINETVKNATERCLKRQVSPGYLEKTLILTIPMFLGADSPPWNQDWKNQPPFSSPPDVPLQALCSRRS